MDKYHFLKYYCLGGCSDGMVRMWSLPGGKLLRHSSSNSYSRVARESDPLLHISFDEQTSVLACGFESGIISLWKISTKAVETVLKDFISTIVDANMLVLLHSWRAHSSRIVSGCHAYIISLLYISLIHFYCLVHILSLPESKSTYTLSAVVLSSGNDQNNLVWTLEGVCIGRLGPHSYSLADTSTWVGARHKLDVENTQSLTVWRCRPNLWELQHGLEALFAVMDGDRAKELDLVFREYLPESEYASRDRMQYAIMVRVTTNLPLKLFLIIMMHIPETISD
jgi:hypothetical protein